MKKVTLITAILILTTSYVASANNNTPDSSNMKPTEITSIVTSEKENTVVEVSSFTDELINNDVVAYIEKYESRKSTSTKSKLNSVQNLLKNPEQKEIAQKILC